MPVAERYTATGDLVRGVKTYHAGDLLPPHARYWADLRYLQRKGLISLKPVRIEATPVIIEASTGAGESETLPVADSIQTLEPGEAAEVVAPPKAKRRKPGAPRRTE